MRRHFPRGVFPLAALVVVAACTAEQGSIGQSIVPSGAAGAGGSAGSGSGAKAGSSAMGGGASGSGGGVLAGPGAIFVVPSDVEALGADCSIDGLVPGGGVGCFSSFFDHPWPSDLRRDASGKVRTKGWPNPLSLPNITDYIGVADRLADGFSPQAAGFVRFTASIDPATLPKDPIASLAATASVQLVDVDDASPEKGKRRLITLYSRDPEGVYWAPHTLAFLPTFGYPLRPHTRYAFVVTTKVTALDGAKLVRPPQLDAVLGLGPDVGATAALRAAWAPALATLAAAGVAAKSIAHVTVFTTTDPTDELFRVRDFVRASYPAPTTVDTAVAKDQAPSYDVYEGNYGPSPDFQEGKIPFAKLGEGGAFAFDANGTPVVQREFNLRYALAVPKAATCPPPPAGYPIVLYAHGTGGDYRSYLGDGTANALAKVCVASMGVDQIFHGTRPGAPPPGPGQQTSEELLFFNFDNPVAARTNGRQSAIDEVQRARLFTESHFTVPADVSRTKSEISFDPTKVLFFGHSQGGLNGPLYLACDDSARGGVLSGSGSIISITLLEKSKPLPSVANLVKSLFLGLKPAQYEELNSLHPEISLAQSIVDALDPIHYVGRLALSPRPGFAPKSIYQTEGVNPDFSGDSYTPPHAIEVQAVATGLPLQMPVIHPITEMAYGTFTDVTIPPAGLSGNLAGGKASGVLAQWLASKATDGHFVVFDIPAAQKQAASFCKNLADDPIGRVPAP